MHQLVHKMRRLELEEAKKQILSMLERGFIQPSDSIYSSPILFVPKKDGSLQFCTNYQWLNKKVVKNWYPLPLLVEMFECLGKVKVFNKIDLRSRYWLMLIKPKDIHKIAFKTR